MAKASRHAKHRKKAEAFRALHARKQAFVIPNPWDVARILARLGLNGVGDDERGIRVFMACPTTRSGASACWNTSPNSPTRPTFRVSADLENGLATIRSRRRRR